MTYCLVNRWGNAAGSVALPHPKDSDIQNAAHLVNNVEDEVPLAYYRHSQKYGHGQLGIDLTSK
jgi:hypothetical protein